MTFSRFKYSGFSLLEVLIAVGIFAVAVSVMLGLLPSLTRQSANSNNTLNALRLPDALRVELQRMAVIGGFDALAAQTNPLAMPLPDPCLLVAPRSGARVHSLVYQPPPAADQLTGDEQYFLIEVWRFSDTPLAFHAGAAVLPLHLRVSWPYRLPGSVAATPLTNRDQLSFNLALNR